MANKKAADYYRQGYNCAQSVVMAFAQDFGLARDTASMMNSGFAAGLGYKGQICGAVLGAYQVIGLKYGRKTPDDELSKELTYAAMKKFDLLFSGKHNSLQCSELLGQKIETEEGLAKAIDLELFHKRCPVFVESACAIVDAVLNRTDK